MRAPSRWCGIDVRNPDSFGLMATHSSLAEFFGQQGWSLWIIGILLLFNDHLFVGMVAGISAALLRRDGCWLTHTLVSHGMDSYPLNEVQ